MAIALAATAALTMVYSGSASARGDKRHNEKVRSEYSAGSNIPVLTSPNVNLVASNPGSAGISGCFTKTAPLFVMSNLDSVRVFDVSDPLKPTLRGTLPNLVFENEAMNCGERKSAKGTERFALIGVDTYDVSADIQHTSDSALGTEMIVVDVTDPTNPYIRSSAPTTTSTHTVTCIAETDCRYVYSAGSGSAATFSIMDLTGYDGSSIFDVTNPVDPKPVTTTGLAGQGKNPDGSANDFNDFIHHNSSRPNASAFKPDAAPSFKNGNILLVTEEDYEQTDCSRAGSFQTWHVKRLDGTPDAIVPLGKVTLADLGTFPAPQYAFCSAHWFDYHPSGVVTVGYYGGGTQLVDVRNPEDLKSYGYATWGTSEVWDSYWVPVYKKNGVATGKKSNLVYSVYLVRGLDIYAVDLPGGTELTSAISLGSTSPFGAFSWPQDALPISLIVLVLGTLVLFRRWPVRTTVEDQ